ACESCQLFDHPDAAHPDLHVITKELAAESSIATLRTRKQMNIPIDLLRERMIGGWVGSSDNRKYFEPIAGKTSQLRRGRVYIIDEAELLDGPGQNALLKTLEEPPEGAYIFLITSNEDRLLPTIRSRCQRVAFAPLEDDEVIGWMNEHLSIGEFNDQQKRWIVQSARGSLGRASLAMDYRMDRWAESVEPMLVAAASGRPSAEFGQTMTDLVEAFAKQWVNDHKGASKDASNKAGVRHMLGLLGEISRQRLARGAAEVQPDNLEAADQRLRPWLWGIELLQRAERELDANVAQALLLDNLAIQWANPK
ncbi:MAG: hypothetical protein ACYTGQ_13810, partial [Planctomycetota bacterium]